MDTANQSNGRTEPPETQGWTRQFTIEVERASEYIELYQALGSEVRIDQAHPAEIPNVECVACLLPACDRYVVLYTRPLEIEVES
jgi:hypothetical protein